MKPNFLLCLTLRRKKQDENIKLNRQFYKYGPENLRNGK